MNTGLVHCTMCLFMLQFSLALTVSTQKGWPGWVDLHGWSHTEMVCLPKMVIHPAGNEVTLLITTIHARTHAHTHTHTTILLPSWILFGTTRMSRHQKGKTNLDLLEKEIVSDSGISWAICKSAPWPRHITTPAFHHSDFLQAGCPSCRLTNSIKALAKLP